MTQTNSQTPTAALLVIGNEILSGRTQDKNISIIATKMAEIGVKLGQVRVIPDVEEEIVSAIQELHTRYTYLFTTGGIGPTHDDITAASVAKAFGRSFVENPDARLRLAKHYGEENLTEARLTMARMPEGVSLIDNPATAAPGFQIENVFVMAGVPSIMKAMLDGLVGRLVTGPVIKSLTVRCTVPESIMAEGLRSVAQTYQDLDIGSYPTFRLTGFGVAFVVRGTDESRIEAAMDQIVALIRKNGGTPLFEEEPAAVAS